LGIFREFFQWLASQLSIKNPDDWIKVDTSKIACNGGSDVLHYHHGNVGMALMDAFPEMESHWRNLFPDAFLYPWEYDSNLDQV
jgi:hypothetical protein